MTYFALQVVGGIAVAMALGALCYLLARTLRLQCRASRQLRLTREMRCTFEDELERFPALFPDRSTSASSGNLRASS